MGIFDTNVQFTKYKVLKEVINRAYEGGLQDAYIEIPKKLAPGPKSEYSCCIYKERAILQERVKMAMGGHKENSNVIEVIDVACDECPIGGIYVTPACRGCMLHSCVDACPKGAITIINHKATIDKEKCIECGACVKACPYGAIIAQHRPCIQSCNVKAISMGKDHKAIIDYDKCISCGACIIKCPFGAIVDKSFVLDIISILQNSNHNQSYKVYAIIAPAIVAQLAYGTVEQVMTAIKQLGFYNVIEVALGADITLYREANEWNEKKTLTTSCCPSFVMYIEKHMPHLKKLISSSPSPMVETAALIKRSDPNAKVVFIGPCSSKKVEFQLEKTKGLVDCVMSFEELQAFVDARGIVPKELGNSPMDNASYYGRIFSRSGGLTEGLVHEGKRLGIEGIKPIVMNGMKDIKNNLLMLKLGKSPYNFFEGMACEGGCVNGALSITHNPKNKFDVDKYATSAKENNIDNTVKLYKMSIEHADSVDLEKDAQEKCEALAINAKTNKKAKVEAKAETK
ncbi:MAG: monomeric [FeFe] hydrogenase [Bacteroidales bacterium]